MGGGGRNGVRVLIRKKEEKDKRIRKGKLTLFIHQKEKRKKKMRGELSGKQMCIVV